MSEASTTNLDRPTKTDSRGLVPIVFGVTGHRDIPPEDAPKLEAAVNSQLECIRMLRGAPQSVRVDNGPEFISKVLDQWAYANGVELVFSRPGKPTDNAYIESFNGRLRQECLNTHWFLSLEDACSRIEAWRHAYNETRPHSALDWQTPAEFALRCGLEPAAQSKREPEISTIDRS